jgi:hypothetical protein
LKIYNMLVWFIKIKMYWNRSMGHLGLPLAIFEKIALLALILKAFNIFNWAIVVISTIIFTLGCILLGWLDVQKGIYEKEISINNQFNPELMKLVRRKNATKIRCKNRS